MREELGVGVSAVETMLPSFADFQLLTTTHVGTFSSTGQPTLSLAWPKAKLWYDKTPWLQAFQPRYLPHESGSKPHRTWEL